MWWAVLLYYLTRPKGVSGWVGDGAAVRDQRQGGRWHGRAQGFHRPQDMQHAPGSAHTHSTVDPNDPNVVQDPQTGAYHRVAPQTDPSSLDPGYAQQAYGGVAYPGFAGYGYGGYPGATQGYGYGAPPTGYGGYWGGYNSMPSDDDGGDPFAQWSEWMEAMGQ